MCHILENSTQEYLADFFRNIQHHGDVFSMNQETLMDQIFKFSQRNILRNSASGDGIGTPVKAFNISVGYDSPLLEFLQMPKRKSDPKAGHTLCNYKNSGQLRKIKELTDQLLEVEFEKASLQEKLTCYEIKCSDYDAKLKCKIEELEELKIEWLKESSENDNVIKKLEGKIKNNIEENKNLNMDLSYLKNHVTVLENELSEKEIQVKTSLNEIKEYEKEVQRLCEINAELEKANKSIEEELQILKETNLYSHQHESLINSSLEESPGATITEPENMGAWFSIRREDVKSVHVAKETKSTWVIWPPRKNIRKLENKKRVKKEKPIDGESWVIPLSTQKSTTNGKTEVANSCPVTEVEYSLTLKPDVKKITSVSSFKSATDTDIVPVQDIPSVKIDSEQSTDRKANESSAGSECSSDVRIGFEKIVKNLQREVVEAKKENDRLRLQLAECEERRRQEKKNFDKRQEELRHSITNKYENQLQHLKSEIETLYNTELAKHKAEQSKLNFEVREQNKVYKDHVDELRNQLWDLGEKLPHEQKMKRDLERNIEEMKKKLARVSYSTEPESRTSQDSDYVCKKDPVLEENFLKQLGSSSFPAVPTEDVDEVFDNRCLEDMKAGISRVEGSEGRLTELQYRNSLCLPHLKSSYLAETQFHSPKLFKENDLKYGSLTFGQESQSLTDSDHSMTRSLPPEWKGKRKEQSSYKNSGPPTPSKNGGRLSMQSGHLHIPPRKVLRESNDQAERKSTQPPDDSESTSGRIRSLFTVKGNKSDSIESKDENSGPVASRGKKLKIFPSVKPFGGREN